MSIRRQTAFASGAGGERLSAAAALALLRDASTPELMARADRIRRRRHGARTYFTHSLNLNPTNVCLNRCKLCAFWRRRGDRDAYVLSLERVRRRLLGARGLGLTDLHVVGGIVPELDLAYYEALLRMAREVLPSVLIQGLTAVEIHYLARREGLPVPRVLRRLRDAGLGAIPGGGAEIFNPRVRARVCPRKISAAQWLRVHRHAHAAGLASNATMLFGHVETAADIVDHLDRLRRLQDRTGGFRAFIALPFRPGGTRLAVRRGPSGQTIVRVVAVARIFLDNFPHVRVLANYMDRKLLGVLAFAAGADDVGGTSLDERIARAAGPSGGQGIDSVNEMETFLLELGLEPRLVNSAYENGDWLGAVRRACIHFRASPPVLKKKNGDCPHFSPPVLKQALAKAGRGERLSAAEAVALADGAALTELGALAHRRRLSMAPSDRATFVLDRNISITNVCRVGCKFCAFHVSPGRPGGFVLPMGQILRKVEEARALGATQVMLQGGLNPELDLAFYENMFRQIRRRSNVCLHSLSPAEVLYLARRAGLSIEQTLERLRAAGLDSLPGGGAEILVPAVRRRVSPRKITAAQWLAVMAAAQKMGMKTTATMVYGLGETTAQRVEHLMRIRDLQDRTGGFTAFIPWSFQPGPPGRTALNCRPQTGVDYLRVVALARLVLDNVPHVQAGWVTEGPDLAQLALSFGADDFGGILMEENVVRSAGVSYAVTREDVLWLIRQAGLKPVQRTTQYEIVT